MTQYFNVGLEFINQYGEEIVHNSYTIKGDHSCQGAMIKQGGDINPFTYTAVSRNILSLIQMDIKKCFYNVIDINLKERMCRIAVRDDKKADKIAKMKNPVVVSPCCKTVRGARFGYCFIVDKAKK